MPVDLMPAGDSGMLTIFVGIRGGLSPEDIESLVTKPIEEEMAALPQLQDMISVSRKERSVISLIFKAGTDSSRVALEVQERLSKISGKLPKEIEKPVVARYLENQSPVIILAMSSKHFTPEQMRDIADNQFKPLLKRVDGVANVEIGGGRERKILVEFDQNRLEAYAISIRQVIAQIGSNNLNILAGKFEDKRESYFVRTLGAFRTLEDIGNLPIAVTKEGSRIRLKDIAEIRDFYLEAKSYSRLNREPAVSAYIQKEALANTISTVEKIKEVKEEFKKNLDPRITLSVVSDQSVAIKKALKNVRNALAEGALLAGFILLIFLRDILFSAIILISIPLSFIVALAFMHLFGLSLNVMTISGLALASGMIVDDSIVVLENIIRHKRKLFRSSGHLSSGENVAGMDLPESPRTKISIFATHELGLALTASTLTKIIVFLPILFLNPQVRMLYWGLSITITSALLISLLVSITMIPCLSENISKKWFKESAFFSTYFWLFVRNKFNRLRSGLSRFIGRSQGFIRNLYKRKKTDPDWVFPTDSSPHLFRMRGVFKTYRRWVSLAIRRRVGIAFSLGFVLLGCGVLYGFLDKEFVGTTEENEFIIFIELPSGAKLEVSDKVVRPVEKMLNDIPEVKKSVKTTIARVEGWSSKIYVTLLEREARLRSAREVIGFLRPRVSKIGEEYDAFIYFSEPTSSKEFIIEVFGADYNQLRDLSVEIAQRLEKVEGLTDIKLRYKPGRPEVRIEVDREKASLFGLRIQDISESLHAKIRGLRATYFLTPTAQVETVARLQEQYRKTLEQVENLSMVNPQGTIVPILQFADFEFGLTPSEVWRKNRERMIQVSANRGDVALSKLAENSLNALKGMKVPAGYYYV